MQCPKDKKLVLALGSAVLGLVFWIAGMAIDSKMEKPAAEGLVLAGAVLVVLAMSCGLCFLERRSALRFGQDRFLDGDAQSDGILVQSADGSLGR